jgi:hypothetical protein
VVLEDISELVTMVVWAVRDVVAVVVEDIRVFGAVMV